MLGRLGTFTIPGALWKIEDDSACAGPGEKRYWTCERTGDENVGVAH